jgi:hypothetical protein
MAYRNGLAAALSRGLALERELEEVRGQQGGDEKSSAWSRLVLRGASEGERAGEAASRQLANS